MIAPQLWVPGLIGLPVDWILFPLWFAALGFRGRADLLFRFELAEKFCVAFVIWMVFGMLINGWTDLSKAYLYTYCRIFILYKMVSATAITLPEVRRALAIFVFFAAILAVEAINHKSSPDLLGWAGQRLAWVDPSVLRAGGSGRARWIGIFDGPGVFCIIFTISLGICFPYFAGRNRLPIRLLALSLVILLSFATYLTGSRGGLLATVAMGGLFVAILGNISARKILLGTGLCIILFMLAPPWMTSIRDENRSAQHRVEMWAQGLEMSKHDPIFGIGRGNFRDYTGRLVAHSSVIEIQGETGIIGVMLWIMLIYTSFKAAILTWKNEPIFADSNVGFGLVLALVGYVISSMFVTLEYETFYFLLALCVGLGRHQLAAQFISKHEILIAIIGIGIWLILLQIFVIIYFS